MNTCPHCGMPATFAAEFACGTQKRGKEFVRFWRCYKNEIDRLRERVAKLTAAGQHAVDYCDGRHSMLNEVIERWGKAKE